MKDIIEEKGTTLKIFCYYFMLTVFFIFIVSEFCDMFYETVFLISMEVIFFGIPMILLSTYFFSHNVCEFTITNDVFIAKRFLCKKLTLQLKDISKIERKRKRTITTYYYIIRWKNKSLILNPYYFRHGGVGFDNIITELQKRVDKANEVKDNLNIK